MTTTSTAASPAPQAGSGTWVPTREHLADSRLLAYCRWVGQPDPVALEKAAREDPGWFWSAVADWLGLQWQRPPHAPVDQLNDPAATRWFPGGGLNLADNAVDVWVRRGRGDELALSWQTEAGVSGSWTFRQLAGQVDRVGHGLIALGIGPGDRVGIQLPMVAQAVVAQLACAKIGAVTVPVFSGFGPGAVTERLRLAGARAHIVANSFPRRGRTVLPLKHLSGHLGDLPDLQHVITVPVDLPHGTTPEPDPPTVPGVTVSGWVDLGLGVTRSLEPAFCGTDHPLLIAYTSGTTGAPKGVVLGHAGFAVKAGSDAAFSFNVGPGDVATWVTDPGWIMSPITVLGGLVAGSAVAVYGGAVDYPSPGRLWQVVRDLRVTMLGVSPTLVRTLMAADPDPDVELTCLRTFASSGEAWTPDAYSWLFEQVGRGRLPVINYSGGTEVSGAIVSNTTCQPIAPCGFAGPLPGMAADVVDPDGTHLETGIGELALRAPSPGMPLTFWGEPDRYRATYWDRWPNTWHHGDWVEVDPDGTWYIRGRSDDTLKVAGKRLGPAEVETLVSSVPGVAESAAIGVPDPVKGEALVVFARINSAADRDQVRALITSAVVAGLGKPLTPKSVLIVDQLPRTRSGKILRRVIKAVHLGQELGDTSSLDDVAALAAVKEAR